LSPFCAFGAFAVFKDRNSNCRIETSGRFVYLVATKPILPCEVIVSERNGLVKEVVRDPSKITDGLQNITDIFKKYILSTPETRSSSKKKQNNAEDTV